MNDKLCPLLFRGLTVFSVVSAVLAASITSQAVTILSGPSFTNATKASLAGTLQLTTDVPSRVGVSVSDGTNTWERNFYDYGTTHSVPLYGFKPGRTNEITVTVLDRYRNAFTAAAPVEFITGPLPADFPVMNVLTSQPAKMEPGYTLFPVLIQGTTTIYAIIVDNNGQVVWYSSQLNLNNADIRRLDDGNIFVPLGTNFAEINLLGNWVNSWVVPNNLKINPHDGRPTDHGTILYISNESRIVTNFPTSSTDSNAPTMTTNVQCNRIIEISSTNGALLGNWSLLDMLDPLRISYLTFVNRNAQQGWDAHHSNAVLDDSRDDSIIVSVRNQNAIIKFSRATGQLKWILGPPANWGPAFQPYLFTPVGTPFSWTYATHGPSLTPQGTLFIYDNGNFRASPFDSSVADSNNYSRAVEYSLNEQTLEVSQLWEYGRTNGEPLYTGQMGNADLLPQTGNVLIDFGSISYVNGVHPSPYSPTATMARIKEVTYDQPSEVVFDLAVFDYANASPTYLGYVTYRSHHVPDLYGHPAVAVADLNITINAGVPHLQFSGDPFRTYSIETSTDLRHWTGIGMAAPGPGGNYDFDDTGSGNATSRYYRVVTL